MSKLINEPDMFQKTSYKGNCNYTYPVDYYWFGFLNNFKHAQSLHNTEPRGTYEHQHKINKSR